MEQASPRRRPAEGGYARGEEVRMKIIEAALRVFGENGYERASTRQIAAEAGVNPPALQYYFDGKGGASPGVRAVHSRPHFAGLGRSLCGGGLSQPR